MAITINRTDAGNISVTDTTVNAKGVTTATSEQQVTGMTHGEITAGTIFAAVTADNATKKINDILNTFKEGSGSENAGKAMDNKTVAEINQLNKEAAMALAINQSLTALLTKVERTVATS